MIECATQSKEVTRHELYLVTNNRLLNGKKEKDETALNLSAGKGVPYEANVEAKITLSKKNSLLVFACALTIFEILCLLDGKRIIVNKITPSGSSRLCKLVSQ